MKATIKLTEIGKSYWNNSGAYQKLFNKLTKKLVPDIGRAENLNGEVMRAVNQLYYEYANNGNCNACEEIPVYDEEGEYDTTEYKLSDYYLNFLDLIKSFLLNSDADAYETYEIYISVKKIIQHREYDTAERYFSEDNFNAYDRMVDYVTYYVAERLNEKEEIPRWYKNE